MMKAQGMMGSDDDKSYRATRYVLFIFYFVVILLAVVGGIISLWLTNDTSLQEWIDALNIHQYNYALAILIIASILTILVCAYGLIGLKNEHDLHLKINAGFLLVCFALSLIATCLLLDYSTTNSSLQPIIRKSMRDLISNSQHDYASVILRQLQEGIGCCGADGPNDYTHLLKPLPAECRDTVTGNAFFHGCVEELTWFFEFKSMGIGFLGMTLGMLNVIMASMAYILALVIERENEDSYRR
ncbi:tetraspanin-2A [Trichogramma pretiosum]|uniref:tetraspanin-2A n=1 Tax=Trichogramma pretiosum TaxID=7493 RepID=UPI0006C95128|nr:tetraspanin-2A [Trichogramma pretiosum]